MRKIIFATNNDNKVAEIQKICHSNLQIISLKEAGILQDIPEPYHTLEENAAEKTRVIYELTGLECFAEDSGLEVFALNGEPGVKSARYAGEIRDDDANMSLLLSKLVNQNNRTAQFRTVIAHNVNGTCCYYEGVCKGSIAATAMGSNGFGYDPIFIPDGYEETFGQLDVNIKYGISHRAKAFKNFQLYLLK